MYINENVRIHPYIHGGAQERNMRAGTENVYGIVGFARALELATAGYEADSAYIKGLKVYMMEQLKRAVEGDLVQRRPAWPKSVYGAQCIISQNGKV